MSSTGKSSDKPTDPQIQQIHSCDALELVDMGDAWSRCVDVAGEAAAGAVGDCTGVATMDPAIVRGVSLGLGVDVSTSWYWRRFVALALD